MLRAVAVAWVLRSDPELGVQDSTPSLPKGDKVLTSEVRGLPVSVKTLKLLIFSQDAKEFFHPLVSLPQTQRYLRDTILGPKSPDQISSGPRELPNAGVLSPKPVVQA